MVPDQQSLHLGCDPEGYNHAVSVADYVPVMDAVAAAVGLRAALAAFQVNPATI